MGEMKVRTLVQQDTKEDLKNEKYRENHGEKKIFLGSDLGTLFNSTL